MPIDIETIRKRCNTILRQGRLYSAQPPAADRRIAGEDQALNAVSAGIRRGHTQAADARQAVAQLSAQLHQPDLELVLFFCSPAYDLDQLGRAMAEAFPGVLTLGCTTAGEITPMGYLTGSLAGLSLSKSICRAHGVHIDRLGSFAFSEAVASVRAAVAAMASMMGPDFGQRTFAMLMIDGMSGAEDQVLSALHGGLGEIPLFGGSAGDDLAFQRTWVYKDGRFHTDMAALVLVHTPFPFRVFKTQHFIGSDTKMVITAADPLRRVVTEINAEPAGREFARMVGLEDVQDLTPMIFATHPVVVRVGGADYVRSIQKVNPDGSLSFFCAIDEGLVLSVARAVDPLDNLTQVFADVTAEIGPPQLIIGCECVLRSLEMERAQLKTRMGELLMANKVVGFNTYGEQFNAMHVNQTFTGVAIGGIVP
jgi:hypothetical protein